MCVVNFCWYVVMFFLYFFKLYCIIICMFMNFLTCFPVSSSCGVLQGLVVSVSVVGHHSYMFSFIYIILLCLFPLHMLMPVDIHMFYHD